jgi:membrane-associated protease RseP (regulator of RpoE activity)
VGLLIRFASSTFLPLLFFLMTVASTLFVGGYQGMAFWAPQLLANGADPFTTRQWLSLFVTYGAPFSLTILSIILAHELGHYLTARRHHVDSTLPIFIPFPFSLIGTLGAFILIRSRFPNRRALIDIGLAGPIAGFIVCIPALIIGIATSRPSAPLPAETSISFGEPLLFQWLSAWLWPNLSDSQVLYVSPIGLAGWFGLLLTAINLLPIGQLDGGHAAYALMREKAHRLSAFVFLGLFPMAYFGPTWLVWAFMAFILGIRRPHPPTVRDEIPLPRSRQIMGIIGLILFVICFTPEPIHFSWSEILSMK